MDGTTDIQGWTMTAVENVPDTVELRKGERAPLVINYEPGMDPDVLKEYATTRVMQAELEDEARRIVGDDIPPIYVLNALYTADPTEPQPNETPEQTAERLDSLRPDQLEHPLTVSARERLAGPLDNNRSKVTKLHRRQAAQVAYSQELQANRQRGNTLERLAAAVQSDDEPEGDD